MKYLLSLYGDESRWAEATPDEMAASMKHWDEYTAALKDAGAHLGGEGLQPSATATTIGIPDSSGDPVVTDGPFAETKEQLGGYYLIDCDDLDAAISWAKRVPLPGGSVEVRPVMDYEAAGGSAEHSNTAEAAR